MKKEVKVFYAKLGLFDDSVVARIQLELVNCVLGAKLGYIR